MLFESMRMLSTILPSTRVILKRFVLKLTADLLMTKKIKLKDVTWVLGDKPTKTIAGPITWTDKRKGK